MTQSTSLHVAIVMDGNGRWAQQQGLKRTDGHAAGEEALFDTVEGGEKPCFVGDSVTRLMAAAE